MKRERLQRGWSRQKLGYLSGVQAPEISKIERRLSVPYPSQRERLTRALDLDSEEILEEVTYAPAE